MNSRFVRTEVAAVIAATDVVEAVTSREAVAKEEIQQLEEGDEQTVTTINTDNDNDNDNIDSNKKEITGDSTTTSTSSSLVNVAGTAAAAVTCTVSSTSTPAQGRKRGRPSESVPTTNKNKKNKSCASNNSNISSLPLFLRNSVSFLLNAPLCGIGLLTMVRYKRILKRRHSHCHVLNLHKKKKK